MGTILIDYHLRENKTAASVKYNLLALVQNERIAIRHLAMHF